MTAFQPHLLLLASSIEDLSMVPSDLMSLTSLGKWAESCQRCYIHFPVKLLLEAPKQPGRFLLVNQVYLASNLQYATNPIHHQGLISWQLCSTLYPSVQNIFPPVWWCNHKMDHWSFPRVLWKQVHLCAKLCVNKLCLILTICGLHKSLRTFHHLVVDQEWHPTVCSTNQYVVLSQAPAASSPTRLNTLNCYLEFWGPAVTFSHQMGHWNSQQD